MVAGESVQASVVVRTYNEARWLPSVFDLLAQQADVSHEVILVDSGSTDGSVAIGERYGARIVHIEKSTFSFGRSLNLGCEAAKGRALVFLSGHCLPVGPHWLRDLIAPLGGDCAYAYGRQVAHPEITKFSERQLFEKFFPAIARAPSDDISCNNANAALLRDVWQDNRFDEALTGLEDMELAKRLVGQGHLIGYAPDAAVVHIHEESWDRVRVRYERESVALQRILPEVHMTLPDAVRYWGSAIAHDLVAAAREGALARFGTEIFRFRTMQYWGAYRGNDEHRKLSRSKKEEYYYPRRRPSPDEMREAAVGRSERLAAMPSPAIKNKG